MNTIKPLATLLIAMFICFLTIGIVGYHTLKSSLIESKKQGLATMLNIARTQSSLYVEQYHQGLLSKEQVDEKITQYLSSLRYGSAYIWANDDNGIARVHFRKEVIGQFQSSYTHHIANLTDNSIFYLTETNIKPVSNKKIVKINSVTKIPEWNWVIGYGLYMDDINKLVINSATTLITTIIISMLLVLSVGYYWLRKVKL